MSESSKLKLVKLIADGWDYETVEQLTGIPIKQIKLILKEYYGNE